jgi:hypothetical protein
MCLLDGSHETTDGVDAVGNDVRHGKANELILNRDYHLKAIKPVRPEIIAKARLVGDALRFYAKMAGYNLTNLERDTALHRRPPCLRPGTNQCAMLLTSTP